MVYRYIKVLGFHPFSFAYCVCVSVLVLFMYGLQATVGTHVCVCVLQAKHTLHKPTVAKVVVLPRENSNAIPRIFVVQLHTIFLMRL